MLDTTLHCSLVADMMTAAVSMQAAGFVDKTEKSVVRQTVCNTSCLCGFDDSSQWRKMTRERKRFYEVFY